MMPAAFWLILTVTAFSGISTAASNDTNATSQREARYYRNEKPLMVLRPTMGAMPAHPIEPMLMSRQFVGPPHSAMHQFPMLLHPGQSGEVIVQRNPPPMSMPMPQAPAFVISHYPPQPQIGPARLYKSGPPPQAMHLQNRPHQKQQQRQPPQQRPQPQRLQPQHHQHQQQQQHRPPPSPQQNAAQRQQMQQQHRKQPPPQQHTLASSIQPIRYKPQSPLHQFNGQPIQSSQKEFRASQPIPMFEKSHPSPLLASDEHLYEQLRTGQQGVAAAPANKYYSFTSADNYLGAADADNSWQPAVAGPGYPQHTDSAEIQQYQTQQRISFYPDSHPEYFQTAAGNGGGSLSSASGSSNSGGGAGKRKKVASKGQLRRRVPTTTTTPASYQSQEDDEYEGERTYVQPNRQFAPASAPDAAIANIRPIYEFQSDDLGRPSKRYDDPDVQEHQHNDDFDTLPEGNVYQSVAVSTSLQTTGADAYGSYSSDGIGADGPALFITPAKPDVHDYERPTTRATTPPLPPTTRAPQSTSTQRKHNNRVFRRKFVPPPAGDSDTCIDSCLSNIVSRVNDPVCGSDERTYENIGRLRCTKLCGDQHLHVAHFGNCESNNNSLN